MTTLRHLPTLLLRLALPIGLTLLVMLPWYNAVAFEAPVFQGDILDEAGILAKSDRDALHERIRVLREVDDIWAAIYLAKSLQQVSIEEAAVDTFVKWKLGKKDMDNGVLILIAPDERKMRIEVGYGLEGIITDVLSRRIIDEVYVPAFREQRFAEGLQQGFEVMAKTKHGENALPDPSPTHVQQEMNWDGAGMRFLLSMVFNLLPVAVYAAALAYGRRHGRVRKTENDEDIRTPLFIFLFFGLFFGIFYTVFGVFSDEPDAMISLVCGNALFAGVFGIPYGLKVRRFLSDAAYRRHHVRSAPSALTASQDGNRRESSMSSSSSFSSDSDSSSSSSDGGSSGGGGSSGSW